MTRDDPELGTVRRCRGCSEEWPLGAPFYRPGGATCEACLLERAKGRPTPLKPTTHRAHGIDIDAKRKRDRERKAALRRDPILGDKMRARQREAQRRFYWRNRAAMLERRRQEYADRLDRPVRTDFGRPRIAA